MKIRELSTPSFLVDLDKLEKNIKSIQRLCDNNNKELWPMTKTHKSSRIAKMQIGAGAEGFLVGTLDEAEILASKGIKKITYPYPVADYINIKRLIEINKMTELYISIDCKEQLEVLNNKLEENNMKIKALIIIDSGLGRFGVKAKRVVKLAREIGKFKNIELVGISTHPGQVYSSGDIEDVKKYAAQEVETMSIAKNKLAEAGYLVEMIATGSTPTVFYSALDKDINVLRPGNYVFYDNIQMSIGVAKEEDCALSVLATVISNPKKGLFLIDAGSKCLGLDKGAHGMSLIKGYGYVKNHPELTITDLSEEVGKIRADSKTNIKIGDKIRIIPNHSCSSANCTDYLIGHRDDKVEETIDVDMRGGSIKKLL